MDPWNLLGWIVACLLIVIVLLVGVIVIRGLVLSLFVRRPAEPSAPERGSFAPRR